MLLALIHAVLVYDGGRRRESVAVVVVEPEERVVLLAAVEAAFFALRKGGVSIESDRGKEGATRAKVGRGSALMIRSDEVTTWVRGAMTDVHGEET